MYRYTMTITMLCISPASIKSFFSGSVKDAKPLKREDLVFEEKVVVPAYFHICGESQAGVEEVKKFISDLISKELYTDIITDEMLQNLSNSDKQHIQELQKKYDVKMSLKQQSDSTVDTKDASLTIEGLSRDVVVASREVQNILRKKQERENLERQIELISNLVEWQHKHQGQYQAFDPQTNFSIEQAKEKNQRQVEITIQGQKYMVALPNGPAVDTRGNQVKLKRIDKLGGNILIIVVFHKIMFYMCICIHNLSIRSRIGLCQTAIIAEQCLTVVLQENSDNESSDFLNINEM